MPSCSLSVWRMRSLTSSKARFPSGFRAVNSITANFWRPLPVESPVVTITGLRPSVVSLASSFWYSGGSLSIGESSASFGSCGSACARDSESNEAPAASAFLRDRVGGRTNDDLAERHGGRAPRLLGFVFLPEVAHLRFRRRDGTELALLLLRFNQPAREQRAALLVGQPAPPFFHGAEPGRAQLIAKVGLRAELLADILVGLLHLIQHFLLCDLHVRIALRLLHEQLFLDHLVEHVAPQLGAPGGVRRQRPALCLQLNV